MDLTNQNAICCLLGTVEDDRTSRAVCARVSRIHGTWDFDSDFDANRRTVSKPCFDARWPSTGFDRGSTQFGRGQTIGQLGLFTVTPATPHVPWRKSVRGPLVAVETVRQCARPPSVRRPTGTRSPEASQSAPQKQSQERRKAQGPTGTLQRNKREQGCTTLCSSRTPQRESKRRSAVPSNPTTKPATPRGGSASHPPGGPTSVPGRATTATWTGEASSTRPPGRRPLDQYNNAWATATEGGRRWRQAQWRPTMTPTSHVGSRARTAPQRVAVA